MKRAFHFRLERVQRVRGIEAELARAELKLAEQLAQASEARSRAGLEALLAAREDLARSLSGGRVEARAVLVAQDHLSRLAQLARRLAERARSERARAEQAREQWRLREQAQRALGRLEERERVRHRTALEGLENAQHDETASRRTAAGSRQTKHASEETANSL